MAEDRRKKTDKRKGYAYGRTERDFSSDAFSDEAKNKSKYLRNPGEKKQSKYLRDKNEIRSKYAKNEYEEREHHYNLARNYRDGVLIEELEALEAEELENEELEADELDAQGAEAEEAVNEAEEIINEADVAENEAQEPEAQKASDDAPKEINEEISEAEDGEELKSVEEYEAARRQSEAISRNDMLSEAQVSIFSHSKLSKETTVARVETAEDARRRVIIGTIISMTVLTVISVLLQFATVHIKYTPNILSVEFSVFPEIIASLAYGPIFGIFIVVVKNIIHLLISNTAYATILSNLVLDSLFVLIGGWFYSRRMFAVNPRKSQKPKKKDMRRRRIIIGCLIAAAVTTVFSYLLTRLVSYPILVRQYERIGVNNYYILSQYQDALDKLNMALPEFISSTVTKFGNLSEAILFYNMPITFFKFMLVSLISSIFYPLISPYLHFRKKAK